MMRDLKKILYAVLTVLLWVPGYGQTDGLRILDLKKSLSLALESHYKIKNAEMDRQKAASQLDQLEAAFFPQIAASTTYQDFIQLPTQLIPGEFFGLEGELIPIQFGTQHNLSASVDVSQVLFSQPLLISRRQAIKAIELSKLSAEKSREDVLYETAQVYFAAQAFYQQAATLNNNLTKLQRLVSLMQEQYDNGYIRKVDLDRVKVNISNLQTQQHNFTDAWQQQMVLLRFMTGIPQSEEIQLTESIEAPVPLSSLKLNPDDHTDYRQAQKMEELADLKIKESKASYLPTLAAIGQYNLQSQQNDFNNLYTKPDWLKMSFIGINLSFPVFRGFNNYYKLGQARIEKSQSILQKNYLASYLEVQYLNSAAKLEVNKKAYRNQLENVSLAEEVYKVTLDLYQQGISPVTEILDAETSLSTAQSALLQAQVQIKLMELDLLKSTGKLNLLINE